MMFLLAAPFAQFQTTSTCTAIKSSFQSVCPCGNDPAFDTTQALARVCKATHLGESTAEDPLTAIIKAVVPHESALPYLMGVNEVGYYANGTGPVSFAASYNFSERYVDPECSSLCPSMLMHFNVFKARSAELFPVMKGGFFQSSRLRDLDPDGSAGLNMGIMSGPALANLSEANVAAAFQLAKDEGCHINPLKMGGCLDESKDVLMYTDDESPFNASMIADGAYLRRHWPHVEETFLMQNAGSSAYLNETFIANVVRAQTMLNRYWMGPSFPELKIHVLPLNAYHDACI